MATYIPPEQVQFAQLAVKQRFITPEQVRASLELYRRYQVAGGEVPSVPRILVGKGWLAKQKAELILRHLLKGEPLTGAPKAAPIPAPAPAPVASEDDAEPLEAEALDDSPALNNADFEQDELGLEEPNSNVDLPVHDDHGHVPDAAGANADHQEAYIEGKGFAVKEIQGYKILEKIGEGARTRVYRAHQLSMDRPVALKVLTADKAKDQTFLEEFFAEARNAGRLNHPNLIRVHEVNNKGDVPYYSMEYVQGQRLDEWMDECEDGRLDPKQAVNVFIQVANALEYGFRQGVIHREIRPNSVMVSEDGQAKLADLSLTKGEESRYLEGENAYYVAPEQVKGTGIDTRADIYSLGCCLFHCLTGEAPFGGGKPIEVMHRRMQVPTPDPRALNGDIPASLSAVVMKMMAREVKDRFQTPAEVADALKKVIFAPNMKKRAPTPKHGVNRPNRPGNRPMMKGGMSKMPKPGGAKPAAGLGMKPKMAPGAPSNLPLDKPRSAQAAANARFKGKKR